MGEITIASTGVTLAAHLFEPEWAGKHPAVLFIHGWTSRQDRFFYLAEELATQGYISLAFDMRGHGASPGDLNDFSRKQFLDDCLAAYDLLASHPNVDASRITVVGSSFGGYMAALVCAERPVQQVAMRVPADYRDSDFEKPLSQVRNEEGTFEWKRNPHDKSETAALRAIHTFTGRVLIAEAELDDIVPGPLVQSYGAAVADKTKLTYVLLKGAPHTISKFPEFQKQYRDVLFSWLGLV